MHTKYLHHELVRDDMSSIAVQLYKLFTFKCIIVVPLPQIIFQFIL